MAGEELYEAMGADYELMVSWEKRLANETPFFKQLFAERGVHRVADVACGVGRHAIEFASWGLDVVGADPSTQLLRIARAGAAEAGTQVRFVEADFLHLTDALDGPFDAVVCIGNSLPHLLTSDEVSCALQQMGDLLTDGGALVVQTRGAERIRARGNHLMSPTLTEAGGRDLIFLRVVDVHSPTVTLNVIRLARSDKQWSVDVKSTELRPIPYDEMLGALEDAGLGDFRAYGGYDRSPFAADESDDLLVVASKTSNSRGRL